VDLTDMDSDRLYKAIDSIKDYEKILKLVPSMMNFLNSIKKHDLSGPGSRKLYQSVQFHQ